MSRIAGTPMTPPTLATTATSPGLIPNNAIEKSDFKNFLIESIEQVNNMQADADKAVETLMTGGDVNPAEVLTAVQKADLTFRMMMQIRNKLVTAYQEIKDVRI
jgi:flagellar hook-basal body complex protein FliE